MPEHDVRVVSHPEPQHQCPLPGWWRRRQLDVRIGTVIECRGCGRRWQWRYGYEAKEWVSLEYRASL